MDGNTLIDRIKSKNIQDNLGVKLIEYKMKETHLSGLFIWSSQIQQ